MINNKIILGGMLLVFSSLMSEAQAKRCPRSCRKLIGNSICNPECDIEECEFDGGDCVSEYDYEYGYEYATKTPAPTLKPTKKPSGRRTSSPTKKITLSPTRRSSPSQPPSRPSQPPTNPPSNKPGVDVSQYNIEIYFANPSTSQVVRDAFMSAKAKWETVILNDIPSTWSYPKGRSCYGERSTILTQDKVVDDLLIFADIVKIDGVNGILGSAGPCQVSTNNGKYYSRVGLMQFDEADMASMQKSGILEAVILHEMGHIIGIGTLWEDYNLIQKVNSNLAYYKGAGGADGLADIGGSGKPQVETNGGGGTAYGHWDDDTYDNELMTGYVDKVNPMSMMTIKSLKDMGFTVNEGAADSYTVPKSRLRKPEGERVKYGDDIIHRPIEYGEANPY